MAHDGFPKERSQFIRCTHRDSSALVERGATEKGTGVAKTLPTPLKTTALLKPLVNSQFLSVCFKVSPLLQVKTFAKCCACKILFKSTL